MCDATITDYDHLVYQASMQRISAYGSKLCTRKATEKVAHLSLCLVHARLAREGLIDPKSLPASLTSRRSDATPSASPMGSTTGSRTPDDPKGHHARP